MKKLKLKSYLVVAALSLMVFTGCGKENNDVKTTDSTIDKKYEKYDVAYAKDVIEVKENESITLDTAVTDPEKFEIFSKESMLGPTPIIIYGDSKLIDYIHSPFLEEKKLDGKITIDPKDIKPKKIKLSNGTTLSGRGDVWPAYEKLYLVQYNDLKTGKKLEKPLVHVVDVKDRASSITAPNVLESFTDDGKLRLEWEPVKDAVSYRILKRTNNPDKNAAVADYYNYEELVTVKENNWVSTPEIMEKLAFNSEDKDSDGIPKGFYGLVVVAEDSSGYCSPESKAVSSFNIAMTLVSDINYDKIENAVDAKALTFEKVEDLPTRMPVKTLANGDRMLPVIYHNSEIKSEKTDNGEIKVTIPFSIKGTGIRKEVTIIKGGEDYAKKVESKVNDVKETLKTGRVIDNTVIVEKEIEVLNQEVSKEIAKVDTKYVANSSLEEFLVTNMLAGKTYLSLEGYPESTDRVTLINAIENLRNDNPIVSSITTYNYSPKTKVLEISYNSEKQAKQKEYLDKISKVIPTIIKDGMTDLEKSKAINDYIAKEATYDYEAFDAIDKYNNIGYKYGWGAKETKEASEKLFKDFGYAMDPEGVLLGGKAVCSGYSEAYYLMANAAGLKAKVVTGDANGGPHAWNLVQIDGKWLVVDVTWNDSEKEPNKYLNISQDDPNYKSDHIIDEKYNSFK